MSTASVRRKPPSVAPRPSRRDLPLFLLLIVVLSFATITIVAENNLRVSGTVDRLACVMKYGSKALLVDKDQFNLGGKSYDLSSAVDRPSVHPLCLVPMTQYFGDIPSKGQYGDNADTLYVALDLAAVDKEYNAAQAQAITTRQAVGTQ